MTEEERFTQQRFADKRPNHRPQRVGESVRRALSGLFVQGQSLNIANIMQVSVTEARMSPDLRNVTVYFRMLSPTDDAAAMAKLLRLHAPRLRNLLAQSVKLRYVPQLHFMHDTTEDTARRIDYLLQNVPNPQS